MKFSVLVSSLVLIPGIAARTITVRNSCPFTIWPALFTTGPDKPNHPTGWTAPPRSQLSFTVPDNWTAGRIWGRRDCNFGTQPQGPNSCVSGGCNGGLLCDPKTGTGVPPVTLAEWSLSGSGNKDFYDVSLVDGFNLPMKITTNKGCQEAECSRDLNPNCPAPLEGPKDNRGTVLGCKSACVANLDGNPGNSPNCCTGSHNTPKTCPPSGVAFYDYFKKDCKNSYVYAYDESSKTALWTCDSEKKADYTVTFCP